MPQLKVKNWEKFQHYHKGRGSPPWIKLYRKLLNDKEWFSLEPVAAKFLISLWILCAETNGVIPDSETIAFRLRIASKDVEKYLNLCSNWIIQDASKLLAKDYQVATPDTETETETETDKKPRKKSKITIPKDFGISEEIKNWSNENGYLRMEERLSHFINICTAKGYEYANWDAAFRNAITGDWAKLGGPTKNGGKFDHEKWLASK